MQHRGSGLEAEVSGAAEAEAMVAGSQVPRPQETFPEPVLPTHPEQAQRRGQSSQCEVSGVVAGDQGQELPSGIAGVGLGQHCPLAAGMQSHKVTDCVERLRVWKAQLAPKPVSRGFPYPVFQHPRPGKQQAAEP